MSENQNTPEQNLPGKEPAQIPQTQPTGSSTPQTKQEMEVHHHGHHHPKKTWKEYLFDFLMLFLAVYLGFLAENWREKGVEKSMETEYMESLVVDLRNDSALTSERSGMIFGQIIMIDSLQDLLSSRQVNGAADIQSCYRLCPYIQVYITVPFNERTIMQLISSGNMRLIKKKGVADSILAYYNQLKTVEEQKKIYRDYINKCMESMYKIFDISLLRSKWVGDTLQLPKTYGSRFLTSDTTEFKKLAADMEMAKTSAYYFAQQLTYLIKEKATDLIRFLEEKYPIKHVNPGKDN